MNPDWSHGYFTASNYTSSYYRETAPNWLDFAVLVNGYRPPRDKEGAPFRYLDLGCGTGFGLCLLAGAYPEGDFLGIDFQPDHIAHAVGLAKRLELTNINFVEADFLDLCANPDVLGVSGNLGSKYHYIVAHGIASWVSSEIQNSLLAIASASLMPGGIFYCSYNTYPGWQGMANFQHLARLEFQRHSSGDVSKAFERSRDTLLSILNLSESPTSLGQTLPRLAEEIDALTRLPASYLSQEYGCENWAPLRVADMHNRCAVHKLKAISTATLPELFDDLLPDQLKSIVLTDEDQLIRQTLIDLATNKFFRRDIFARGIESLPALVLGQRLGELTVCLNEAPPVENYRFSTTFGEVHGNHEGCLAIESCLRDGARSIAEIHAFTGESINSLVAAISLLLHVNRLGLDRGDAASHSIAPGQRINSHLTRLMEQGASYEWLVAPSIGSCCHFSLAEHFAMRAISGGLEREMAKAYIFSSLASLGLQPSDLGIAGDDDATTQRDVIDAIMENLSELRLPALYSMGVFPACAQL